LAAFDERLAAKPQIIAFNKMDMPDAQSLWPLVRDELEERGYEVLAISGIARQGTRELLYRVSQVLVELPPLEAMLPVSIPVLKPDLEKDHFSIERDEQGWRVCGARIERIAYMTRWDLYEAVSRFQKTLDYLGISKALEEAGVRDDDVVFIGEAELVWGEQVDGDEPE